MEIKVTNFVLSNPFLDSTTEIKLEFIHPALQEFKKLKLPLIAVECVIKSIKAVEQAISDYHKMRIAILESICERGEQDKPVIENNQYKLSDEGKKEWNEKWTELLNKEITLDIFPIKKSHLANIKEINIGCYETLLKYGFIEE